MRLTESKRVSFRSVIGCARLARSVHGGSRDAGTFTVKASLQNVELGKSLSKAEKMEVEAPGLYRPEEWQISFEAALWLILDLLS